MRFHVARGTLGVAALALIALMVACEDSALTVPGDGSLVLRANPSTVVIDANQLVEEPPGSGIFLPQTKGTSTLSAQAFDGDGKPLENISILFGSGAGALASGGKAVKTDGSGIAQDTLTLANTDPTDVEVTATSSAISTKITVKKLLVSPNQPPTAIVVAAPRNSQGINEPVLFDGTASVDPDDDLITMYRWTLNSTNPDPGRPNPYVVEDPAASALELFFQNVQNLSVSLQVTDNPDAVRLRDQGLLSYSPVQDTLVYAIERCGENVGAPTAVIGGSDPIQAFGTPGQNVTVPLDGSASSDPEWGTDLSEYRWACGNQAQPQIQGQAAVTCTYQVQSLAVDYTVTLTVIDKGTTGQIDPQLGDYCNKKQSEQKTRIVRVSPRI